MRDTAYRLLLICSTLALAVVLWQFRHPLFLLLVAIALAAALRPVAHRLQARGIPPALAMALFFTLALALLIGVAALTSAALREELTRLSNDLVLAYDRLVILTHARARDGSSFAASLPRARQLAEILEDRPLLAAGADLVNFTGQGLATLAALGFAMVLSIYWVSECESIVRLGLSVLRVRRRQRVEAVWRAMEDRVGAIIRHTALESIIVLLVFWLLYSLIGLRYPIILALFGAGAALFPWLGPVIQAAILLLAGSIGGFPLHALAALLSFLIYLGVHRLLTRREAARRLPDPLLLLISLLFLAQVYGPVGVLFAAPLASVLHALLRSLFTLRTASEEHGTADLTLVEIETRLAALQRIAKQEHVAQDKMLANLLARLQSSIGEVQMLSRSPNRE